jgi:hypothetical protein
MLRNRIGMAVAVLAASLTVVAAAAPAYAATGHTPPATDATSDATGSPTRICATCKPPTTYAGKDAAQQA